MFIKRCGTYTLQIRCLVRRMCLINSVTQLPYSGNFQGENFRKWWEMRNLWIKLLWIAKEPLSISGCGRRFSRRKLADSPKTTKFAKVFSLERFPLYGMCSIKKNMRLTASCGYLTNNVYMCMIRVYDTCEKYRLYTQNV